MPRRKIGLMSSSLEVAEIMSEGNPGALHVICDLLKAKDIFSILGLDDMNLRGSLIWLAYKDYCKCDLPQLIGAISSRDPEMVAFINQYCNRAGVAEKAVISGASYTRERVSHERY